MGLRLGEGINLTVGDIDSKNMHVHIRNAKGNKDRLVPLPVNTLRLLKKFWKVYQHPHFIFPSRKRGVKIAHPVTVPIDRGGIQVAMKKVITQLGIKKKSHATPCVTASPRICRRPALTFSNFRKSWAMSVY